jgi:hypothetical protein
VRARVRACMRAGHRIQLQGQVPQGGAVGLIPARAHWSNFKLDWSDSGSTRGRWRLLRPAAGPVGAGLPLETINWKRSHEPVVCTLQGASAGVPVTGISLVNFPIRAFQVVSEFRPCAAGRDRRPGPNTQTSAVTGPVPPLLPPPGAAAIPQPELRAGSSGPMGDQ